MPGEETAFIARPYFAGLVGKLGIWRLVSNWGPKMLNTMFAVWRWRNRHEYRGLPFVQRQIIQDVPKLRD